MEHPVSFYIFWNCTQAVLRICCNCCIPRHCSLFVWICYGVPYICQFKGPKFRSRFDSSQVRKQVEYRQSNKLDIIADSLLPSSGDVHLWRKKFYRGFVKAVKCKCYFVRAHRSPSLPVFNVCLKWKSDWPIWTLFSLSTWEYAIFLNWNRQPRNYCSPNSLLWYLLKMLVVLKKKEYSKLSNSLVGKGPIPASHMEGWCAVLTQSAIICLKCLQSEV